MRGPPLHVKKCSKVLSIVPLHSKCIRAMTFENLYQARARTLGSHSPHVQEKKYVNKENLVWERTRD